MKVIPVESGPFDTIGYFVFDEIGSNAIVIDAPLESSDIFLGLSGEYNCRIEKIILTHSHWDHTADAFKLREKTNSKIYMHKDDEYRVISPMEHTFFDIGFKLIPFHSDEYLSDGDKIYLDSLEFEVIHTPGHTEGGVCLIEKKQGVIFSGDTIFYGSIGRTDLQGGSTGILLKSIKNKILTLPDDFKIFCGHGPSTTVGYEKANNYYLS